MSEELETVIQEALDDATAVPAAELDTTPAPEPQTAAPAVPDSKPQDDPDLGPQWRDSGRENRIPYSRVQKIIENRLKKATSEWETKVKEHTDKIGQYEPMVQKMKELDSIIFNDPKKFVEILRTVPGYADHLAATQAATGHTAPQVQPGAGMPQPDLQLPDGSKTYSLEGLQKLMAWQEAKVEQRLSQRYAPLEQSFKAHAQMQAVLPKVQQQLAEAAQWPLFKESEGDIVKALQANPSWGLERAYQNVVLPKLQSDRSKVREEVLAEINARPRSTATTPTTPVAPKAADGPRSTEDIIREALKGAK